VHRDPNSPVKEICIGLVEKNAMDLADRLEEVASQKYPNPNGIRHAGYLVATKASLARLRLAAAWRSKVPSPWGELKDAAILVPNDADRVFVLTLVAGEMALADETNARALLALAKDRVLTIPNILDRSDRLYTIASTWWRRFSDAETAKQVLGEGLGILKPLSPEERDETVSQILELANDIDPDFAGSLTPVLDDPLVVHENRIRVASKELQRDPGRIDRGTPRDRESWEETVALAARRMLKALNSGVGTIRHPREIGRYLMEMADANFETYRSVESWAIQNTIAQMRQPKPLADQLEGVLGAALLIISVGQVVLGIRAQSLPTASLILPDNLLLFKAGSQPSGLTSVQDWVRTSISGYLKIYDPYFRPSDLQLLKYVPAGIKVFIVTTWRAQRNVSVGDRHVDEVFRQAWRSISESTPPWTQITIVGTRSGNSPMHSRYLITDHGGINLGTSIGSLDSKDTDLRILSPDEATRVEAEFVDPQLGPQWGLFNGEPLEIQVFTL
jgi:hypothetical protein